MLVSQFEAGVQGQSAITENPTANTLTNPASESSIDLILVRASSLQLQLRDGEFAVVHAAGGIG